MSALVAGFVFVVGLLTVGLTSTALAQERPVITLKFGTLGPKDTNVTNAVESLINDYLDPAAGHFGYAVKLIPYYGGVMGDDNQMLQKAQMGQLDIITPTVNAQPSIAKELEVPYMAYLIDDYGRFDRVMRDMKDFNDVLYEKGFVNITQVTEGMHDLYMAGSWRSPEALKKNLKACNYTGGPDATFFRAHGIPQTPIQPPEMFSSFKAGLSNAVILPSMFVIGMQIYTALPYIVEPSVRTSMTAALITKPAFDRIPKEVQPLILMISPLLHWTINGIMRDGAVAFTMAMVRYGSMMVSLTPEELAAWEKPCIAYRECYLGNDKVKRVTYAKITAALKSYDNSIEKAIFEADPSYAGFPDKEEKLASALEAYIKTGSKEELGKLEDAHVIEKWRLYDLILAAEKLIQTGDTAPLISFARTWRADDEVEDYIVPNQEALKKVFGTKEALNQRMEEIVRYLRSPKYKGFQKKPL